MSVLVTGGTGMVGTALKNVLPDSYFVGSSQFDLRCEKDTMRMFSFYEPDRVIHLAAKVGGIKANSDNLGTFYLDNIKINTNVLEAARKSGCSRVISLLSTCVYPDRVNYPLTEEQIHLGEPHESNYAYAYAKRMLDVQSRAYRKQYGCDFITAVPNNLYGENDNFDLENGHVIPALMRRIWEAKINNISFVKCWGDGTPLREFTYSEDIAHILAFLLENYSGTHPINIGNTSEHSIKELVKILCEHLGYNGEIIWDTSKPSGQHKKPSSNDNLLNLGWSSEKYTRLKDGLKKVCEWFIMNYPNVRGVK